MGATARIRAIIKKCLALANSPEEHEAASARAEAERLMRRHGFTEADFEDEVVEVADDRRDDLRQRLAKAVGLSRRCVAVVNGRGQIAFRGRTSCTSTARELYQHLVREVSGSCEIGPRDPGRDVWRLCYWSGFVDAVVERLIDDEARAWQPPKPEEKSVAVAAETAPVKVEPAPSFHIQLSDATRDFAAHFHPSHVQMGVKHLREDAYRSGQSLGKRVEIKARDRAAGPDRALGQGERA